MSCILTNGNQMAMEAAKISTWITTPCHPPSRKPEMIGGVVHGTCMAPKAGRKPMTMAP